MTANTPIVAASNEISSIFWQSSSGTGEKPDQRQVVVSAGSGAHTEITDWVIVSVRHTLNPVPFGSTAIIGRRSQSSVLSPNRTLNMIKYFRVAGVPQSHGEFERIAELKRYFERAAGRTAQFDLSSDPRFRTRAIHCQFQVRSSR
jgi:hypothetical protein